MALKRIVKQYTPTTKALDTIEEQTKTIQELYDQVRNFYDWLNSPEFNSSLKGEKGDKGDVGEQGIQGIPGARGADGNIGPQGPRGLQGVPGEKGDTGPRGENGLNGERGPAGPIGPRGLTGPAGANGAKGEQGEKGDIGASFGLVDVQNTYADIVSYSPKVNAGFYLVASRNKENGDVYVYREKYDDFVFINNIIYDLYFQLMQAPPGRNFLNIVKGVNADKYGNITIDKEETIDVKGYLHTKFTLNFLKGNGIADSQWNESQEDDAWSTLTITYDNGETDTIRVKNGSTGAQGPVGPQGPKGEKGDKGDKGDTGEKGDKGDKGDTGEKGDKGDTGNTGPQGETGPQGIDGKSSYQLAVDGGYQGTIEEFLQLIKEIYIGAGSTYSDIFINDNKYENIKSPSTFNITTNNNKIIIVYPNTNIYMGTPKINGINIPFVVSTFIEDNVQFNVLTSVNTYNTNLNITI